MPKEEDKEWLSMEISKIVDIKIEEMKKTKTKWDKFLDGVLKIGTPSAILGAVWIISSYNTTAKILMFDSAAQKAKVVDQSENAIDPIILHELSEHVTSPEVHMSRRSKDSIYVRTEEFNELVKNYAIDQYDIKRNVQKISENQKSFMSQVMRSLDVFEYKLEKIVVNQNK